jgi:hypothetical protein
VSDPAWPAVARFRFGQYVERAPLNGRPPAYRFPGYVCGVYYDFNNSYVPIGYVVAREGDPGCKQIFPEHMLVEKEDRL